MAVNFMVVDLVVAVAAEAAAKAVHLVVVVFVVTVLPAGTTAAATLLAVNFVDFVLVAGCARVPTREAVVMDFVLMVDLLVANFFFVDFMLAVNSAADLATEMAVGFVLRAVAAAGFATVKPSKGSSAPAGHHRIRLGWCMPAGHHRARAGMMLLSCNAMGM